MTNEEKIRAEFEKVAVAFRFSIERHHPSDFGGRYISEDTNTAYIFWQAALATRPDVKPKSKEECQRICELKIRLNEDGSYGYSHSGLLPMDKIIEAILQQNPDAMPSHPDVNQELVEALDFYWGSDDENYKVWIRKMQSDCGTVAGTALAKHKAGESAGFTEEELVEILADIEHERWSKWMRWMFNNYSETNIERWKSQMQTPYSDLSEHSKESDRKEARITLTALKQCGALRVKGLVSMTDELKADKYAYILTQDNRLMLGGGSSTKPQVRMYATFDKAIKMRNLHFPKASIKRVSFSDIGSGMYTPYNTKGTN